VVRVTLALLVVVVAAVAPRAARADGPVALAPDPTAPVRLGFRLRVMPPFLSYTLLTDASEAHGSEWWTLPGTRSVGPTLIGLSVALEFDRRWSLEVGSNQPLVFNGIADVFVRAGLSNKLAGRGGPGHWTHHLLVYGGYRYLVLYIDNDSWNSTWPHHGLVANLGLETTRWFTRRVGVSFRLLLGFDLLLRRNLEPNPVRIYQELATGPYKPAFGFDFGLDVGLAF
jgi:hypothetical protein